MKESAKDFKKMRDAIIFEHHVSVNLIFNFSLMSVQAFAA